MINLYRILDSHEIQYERHDHPPVYTVEQADRLVPPVPAVKTKNLFLRDQKGKRHFLVCLEAARQVNLKKLAGTLGVKRISFGSAARLQKYLGVAPGAVSVFGLINDTAGKVELVFDSRLWENHAFQFHPLVNTSTLCVSRKDIEKFVALTGHRIRVLDLPGKEQARF